MAVNGKPKAVVGVMLFHCALVWQTIYYTPAPIGWRH